MSDILIPFGYGVTYKPLVDVEAWLLVHHHPEYVRRLVPWLRLKNGEVGVGGGWRPTPSSTSQASQDGKSFHQDQRYNDGFVGACAVDLVAKDGADANFTHDGVTWATVLPQGSDAAKVWGLHCNVSGEPWHMQPIEIDGWQSWANNGRPAPKANYPIPGPPPPVVVTSPPPGSPSFHLGATDASTVIPGAADKGRVSWLQACLKVGVDGQFGPATDAALRAFQTNVGLVADGWYGTQTAAKLAAYMSTLPKAG